MVCETAVEVSARSPRRSTRHSSWNTATAASSSISSPAGTRTFRTGKPSPCIPYLEHLDFTHDRDAHSLVALARFAPDHFVIERALGKGAFSRVALARRSEAFERPRPKTGHARCRRLERRFARDRSWVVAARKPRFCEQEQRARTPPRATSECASRSCVKSRCSRYGMHGLGFPGPNAHLHPREAVRA
jgi:hypothetical protein